MRCSHKKRENFEKLSDAIKVICTFAIVFNLLERTKSSDEKATFKKLLLTVENICFGDVQSDLWLRVQSFSEALTFFLRCAIFLLDTRHVSGTLF